MPIPCPIRFVHPFPNAEDRVNRCHTRYEVLDGHLVVSKCCYAPPHPEPRIGRGVGGGDNMCLMTGNIVQRCWNLLATVSIAISFPPSHPVSPWQVALGSKPSLSSPWGPPGGGGVRLGPAAALRPRPPGVPPGGRSAPLALGFLAAAAGTAAPPGVLGRCRGPPVSGGGRAEGEAQ